MKTTLRRIFTWQNQQANKLPLEVRHQPYNIRLDQHAHSLNYALARPPFRVH